MRWITYKKIFALLAFVMIIVCSPTVFAEETQERILIRTVDNSKAIEVFKNELPGISSMLARWGFNDESKIGTPFSVEYQSNDVYGLQEWETNKTVPNDGYNVFLFYFPIINDGKIAFYAHLTMTENGTAYWAVSNFFSGEEDLMQLSDGNVYYLVNDLNDNVVAVSDERVAIIRSYFDSHIDYNTPYKNVETSVVNILEPIDIDTSSVISQTPEERAVYKSARENGKGIILMGEDKIGAVNEDGSLFIPLRYIAETTGYSVDWDNALKAACAQKEGKEVKFIIGTKGYYLNGDFYDMDSAVKIHDGKTYISLPAVKEALGVDIAYNAESRDIVFSY